MAEPRTLREALAAQILGEVDSLVARVEALPGKVSDAEAQLKATTEALTEASDKFRLAVTAFTEQAKGELTEHLERKAAEVVSRTVEDQRAAMQEAARLAFRSQASDQAANLAGTLRTAASEFRRTASARMLENGAVALIASGVTAAVVYGLLR
jgi:acetylornithine deacetylase/succinyl-diaminopimelate desuccinylase-like protein